MASTRSLAIAGTAALAVIGAVAGPAMAATHTAPTPAKAVRAKPVRATPTENSIVGGTRSPETPWVVQLIMTKGTAKYGCTGEAIASEWVLTARHCIRGVDTMDVYYSNDATNRGAAIRADKMLASPKGDVALLHLSAPKELNEYGKVTKSGYTATAGESAKIMGYGLRANKGKTDGLYEANVSVLGESRDAFMGSAIHIRGVDGASNHGDSGGPIIVNNEIVGVCSTGDSADPGANINAGSNYANLYHSLDWIRTTTGVA